MRYIKTFIISVVFLFIFSNLSVVSAHVVVKPNEGVVSSFQTFTVGVPNEKGVSTTTIRLIIPNGLKHVSPNVKPGWNIEIKKNQDSDQVEEIIWSGGNIPSGQRDDFMFSTQLPSEETMLTWKAYQTYQDGTIVSWDQTEEKGHSEENSDSGPASTTSVINDLKNNEETPVNEDKSGTNIPLILSIVAVALSGWSIYLHFSKK